MGNNWSEEELKALGFVEDARGNWSKPEQQKKAPGVGARDNNSHQVSERQSNHSWQIKRKTGARKENEAGSKKSNQEVCAEQTRYVLVAVSYETKKSKGSDTDNVFPKWFIDEIIKSGITPPDLTDDNFEQICATIKAIKRVETKKEERTKIKIYRVADR